MGNPAMTGMEIGTVIMPGAGTVIGAATGGLVGLFSGPDAKEQSANVGGRSIDARQIWEQINPGKSDSLHEGAKAAGTLQGVHDNRATQIDEINKAMDAAWQGDASLQVQAGAHPLGIWLRDSATNLQKSGSYLTKQGEAFDAAHSQVQEIAATPPHAGFLDHMNPFSDKDDEINKYNEQGQANVRAFQNYYNASATNAAGMPQYSAWQGNNFSNGSDKPGPNQPNPPNNTGSYPPSIGTGPGNNTGNLPRFDSTVPNTGSLGHTPDTNSTNHPAYTSSENTFKQPNWDDSTTAAGYTPSTSGTDFGNGFGPSGSSSFGGGGFGPGGSGAGGFGGGAGGIGAGGIGAFGPGGAGALGDGASTGSGASSGAGGAAGAGRGGAGAGAAGAAGRGGTSGMAGMGRGGKGKGSDDEEHQTKYLVSDDPNELFGTDELTAPPVIGE